MAVYYVDTFNGNDANDGSSWAQAWKSTQALWALYGSLSTVADVEVRIAKTPVSHTVDLDTMYQNSYAGAYLYTYVNKSGYVTSGNHLCLAGNPGFVGYFQWTAGTGQGSTVVSPFTASTDTSNNGNTNFSMLNAPAGATGNACYWLKSNVDLTSFYCLELWARHNGNGTVGLTLDLCSDTAGASVLRSYPINIDNPFATINITVCGAGDLPSGVNSVYLRVTQNTCTSAFQIYLTRVIATANPTSSNYRGYRSVLMPPSNKPGMPMAVVAYDSANVNLSGVDSSLYSDTIGGTRTFTAHVWNPVAVVNTTPAFAAATVAAGTPLAPIKIIGGYNTATGLVDGVSCVDQALIGLLPAHAGVSITLHAENLIIANYRSSTSGTVGMFQKTIGTGPPTPVSCYFRNVHAPCPTGPASSLASFRYAYSVGFLFADTVTGTVPGCIVIEECMTFGTPILGNGTKAGNVEFRSCRFSQGFHLADALVEDSMFFELRYCYDNINTTTQHRGLFRNCEFWVATVGDTYGGVYDLQTYGLKSDTEDCSFYGAGSGPCSVDYTHTNPKLQLFSSYANNGWCTRAGTIDNLTFLSAVRPGAGYAIFTGAYGAYGPVTFKNLNNLSLGAASLMYIGDTTTEVTMVDCSLTTSGNTGGIFNGYATGYVVNFVNSSNVTISGGAPYLCNCGIMGSIANLNLGNTALALSVRESYDNWWRVGFYATDYQGALPIASLTPQYIGGSVRLTRTSGEVVWFSGSISMEKDYVVKDRGPLSWKMVLKGPVGYLGMCQFLLGTLQVVAGIEVVISCRVRRVSTDVRAGLLLYCGSTMEWVGSAGTPVNKRTDLFGYSSAAPGVWDTLTLSYTPANAGAVSLLIGAVGAAGNAIWFDTVKVEQIG